MSDKKVVVKKISIGGVKYLIDTKNNLYDPETYELIGTLNRETKKISLYEDEEEDEEDEEDEEEEEKLKVEFAVSIGDFWKKLSFTKVPNSYWDIDTWDNQADLLDYEDKKRFMFVSKPLRVDKDYNDIQYELIIKKEGKKIDPIGVVIIDKADKEMLLLLPNEEFNMFLTYFGRGDIVDNLLASGFIDADEEEEEEPIAPPEPKVAPPDELTSKVTEYKSLAEIYKSKKAQYEAGKTKELKVEILLIKADLERLLLEIKALSVAERLVKEGKGIASYSNAEIAKKNAVKYLGKSVVLKPSTKKDKKFMVLNPVTNKFIHFGQLGFEDFTKHQDLKRQKSYLNRTGNMRGDWKADKYSANNLAREILWR
jgi:hypothetical protein